MGINVYRESMIKPKGYRKEARHKESCLGSIYGWHPRLRSASVIIIAEGCLLQ